MHPVRADADETVERSEPRRTATVGREQEGKEASDPNGRRRGRHIRLLLVPDTGTYLQLHLTQCVHRCPRRFRDYHRFGRHDSPSIDFLPLGAQ